SEDQDPIQAFAANRADKAFRVGIGAGCLDRGADHAQSFGSEHLVECAGELRVAIADQETPIRDATAHGHYQVACLLGDPDAAGMFSHAGEMYVSSVELD